MIETVTPRQAAVATVVRVLVILETVAFLLAALLHLGERIPVGFAILATDRILPAAIVEGLTVSLAHRESRRHRVMPAALAARSTARSGDGERRRRRVPSPAFF